MSNFKYDDFSEEAIDSMVQKGGKAKGTLAKESSVLRSFTEFVNNEEDIENLVALWSDKPKLDSTLSKYFYCFRLLNGELPKRNTVECYKSFLKQIVLKNTNGQWDICDKNGFPKFTAFYKG